MDAHQAASDDNTNDESLITAEANAAATASDYRSNDDKDSDHINSNNNSSHIDNNKDKEVEDEPMCRICQITRSEAPEMRLVRPCKCTGSLCYVHLDCLNQWRSTSTVARQTCSVCKYDYQFRRTAVAVFLLSEQGAVVITIAILLVTICALGLLSNRLTDLLHARTSPYHPINFVYTSTNWKPWWWFCDQLMLTDGDGSSSAWLAASRLILGNKLRTMTTQKMVKYWYENLDDADLQTVLFCHFEFVPWYRVLEHGLITISLCGMAAYMTQQVRLGQIWANWPLMGYWATLWMNPAIVRLTLGLGCAFACRHVFLETATRARRIGQFLGEKILEMNP